MAVPEVLVDGLGFTEGPAWLGDGRLAVTSITQGQVHVIRDGALERSHDVGGGPNGLVLADDGSLYVAQNGGIWGAPSRREPGIQRIASDGTVTTVATGFGAPNDVCFGSDGRLWVTDLRGESDPSDPSTCLPGRVIALDPATGAQELLVEGPVFTNSLALDDTEEHLFLVETARGRVLRYRLSGAALHDDGVFCEVDQGVPDGLAFDVDGNLWVTTAMGDTIEVRDPDGKLVDTVEFAPGTCPTNCCFGGVDGSTLYVTGSMLGQVLTVATTTQGLPVRTA